MTTRKERIKTQLDRMKECVDQDVPLSQNVGFQEAYELLEAEMMEVAHEEQVRDAIEYVEDEIDRR